MTDKLHICLECGAKCCRSGPIVVTVFDIARICKFLCMSVEEVFQKYLQVMSGLEYAKYFNLNLNDYVVEKLKNVIYITLKLKDDGSCIFLKDNLCTIYPVRPMTCRVFPLRVVGIVKDCPLSKRKDLLTDEEKTYSTYLKENFRHAMYYLKCQENSSSVDELVKCLLNYVKYVLHEFSQNLTYE